ncbi:nitroreductase [archaeon CG10_big_fil_rev_8_21_14_0_10_43_11]|nr:MAG: nitroreductase [archaeon CG10_big_fil_rev_8_21_14_0_10_43_11]
MELFDALMHRRSTRRFLSYPIEREQIFKLLDAADRAPSAGNLDNWKFILVEDEHMRLELASACHAQFWMAEAPLIIVVLSDIERVKRVYGSRAEFFATQSIAASIQNLLLAAEELDLGACWVGSFDEKWVKRVLAIPDKIDVHALIPVGPKGEKPPEPKRYPLDTKVFFEKYGKTSR